MSKKTFQLISGIVGGVQAIAVAVVTYTSPEYAAAINGAVVIIGTAVIDKNNFNIFICLPNNTLKKSSDKRIIPPK